MVSNSAYTSDDLHPASSLDLNLTGLLGLDHPRLTCHCNVCNDSLVCESHHPCILNVTNIKGGPVKYIEACADDGITSAIKCDTDIPFWHSDISKGEISTAYCCLDSYCNNASFLRHLGLNPHDQTSQVRGLGAKSLSVTLPTILVVLLGLMAIAALLIVCRVRKRQLRRHGGDFLKGRKLVDQKSLNPSTNLCDPASLSEWTGSGCGVPFLSPSTVVRQVQLVQVVGQGRYGEVWKGVFQGGFVAVKKISCLEEDSWKHEVQIYNTCMLHHENVLGFIATDFTDVEGTSIFWLITHFCENGSLYDYLNGRPIDVVGLCRLSYTMTKGLAHLHTEVQGVLGKPPIAHRDIKSKNVLVRKDGTCCISDFGLATLCQSGSSTRSINVQVGTRRYMAPEILDKSLNVELFESFKQADIYSLSLVLWELMNRTIKKGFAPDYLLPYHDMVPSDPTFEDMLLAICTRGLRPEIPTSWLSVPVLESMSKVVVQCWAPNPSGRLSSLRIKKSLAQICKRVLAPTMSNSHVP